MSDDLPPRQDAKTDWSRVSNSIAKTPEKAAEVVARAQRSAEAFETNAIQVPELSAPSGILSQFKANLIKRRSAMAALQTHYDSQLDVLSHTLARAGQVEKSRADVVAEEYLKELDAKHLEVLAELGMRNKETRERALIALTDQTVIKVREVMSKDWPEELIQETLQELFTLRKRVIAEILRELGSAYATD